MTSPSTTRQARTSGRLVACTRPIAGGKLDRQVQPAPRPQGPAEALQDRWPILWWDELDGVHAQHAVELALGGPADRAGGGDLGNFAAAVAR